MPRLTRTLAVAAALVDERRRRLFRPLGLRATSFPIGPRIGGRHAHGYLSIALESPDREREAVALVNAKTFAETPGDAAAEAAWARLIDDAFCR